MNETIKDQGIMQLAESLLISACDENRFRDNEIMQGVDGEKEHAKDVLAWVEKLADRPSICLKIVALFHDVDRVITPGAGGGFKGDRESSAYLEHKKAHAKRSADYISQRLSANGVEQDLVTKIKFLISHHDDTGEEIERLNDPELKILVAADSLSFFTTLAPKMLQDEGEKRLSAKMRFMIKKMPGFARVLLASQKLEDPILERLKNGVFKELDAA